MIENLSEEFNLAFIIDYKSYEKKLINFLKLSSIDCIY